MRIPGEDRLPDQARPADIGTTLSAAGGDAADVLRAVARMSPLPMLLSDPHAHDCPTVFCNKAFAQLTGYREEEVLGRNPRFLQGEATDPQSRTALRDAVAGGREVQVELWNYRKDGSRFWCSMFVGPVLDRGGKLVYWFGSQLDATARRDLEEARAQARRMDTLGLMAAGIAHEFNNLMTVVIANAEGVRASTLSARQAERLDRVDWGARAAGRLTEQMLSFAGRSSLQAEVADLTATIGNLDRLLTQVIRPSLSLEVRLEEPGLLAKVDAGQLELALVNLVRNASDASHPGGRIIISARGMTSDGLPMVEVSVTDEGCGMRPDVASKAAEPFFTTKPHGEGPGLGLSMVSGFVQQSGGRVAIKTEPGAGTIVRLVLPRIETPP